MNPGAPIRPLASMVRVASPVRPGPIAAMRSPSSATSAWTRGAPLPSITHPSLTSSDQAKLFLDDRDGLHAVALLDAVDVLHARDHVAEHRIVAVEVRGGSIGDVELAARGVGVLAARHGHAAAHVLLLVELGLHRVAGAAGAVALGAAALDHEVRHDAMKREVVVEALLGQR